MNAVDHEYYMTLALRLAEHGRLTVSPNPMVGCVIVKNNRIIGQGYHQRCGGPHAEVYALKEAGEHAHGATAYITLEPCCHHGRTPPCTDALIAAGIKEVYIPCVDPNPLVAGNGIATLQAAGIKVKTGCCAHEAQELNEIFFHFMQHQRPFVIAKWAMSLDGKTITNPADHKQISCPESQQHTHDIRQQVDAILVGANTLIDDNPKLTARITVTKEDCQRQPIRIILAGHRKISNDLKIFNNNMPGKTMIAASRSTIGFVKHLATTNTEIMMLPENNIHQICLKSLLNKLGDTGITSVLVEGGMTVHDSFFKENLVNKIHVYLSPIIIGSHDMKKNISFNTHSRTGKDFHFTAKLENESNV